MLLKYFIAGTSCPQNITYQNISLPCISNIISITTLFSRCFKKYLVLVNKITHHSTSPPAKKQSMSINQVQAHVIFSRVSAFVGKMYPSTNN